MGSSPQHLLVTLLGDNWLGERGYLSSAALVRRLGEFGVTETGAGAASTRLGRRSIVEPTRQGGTGLTYRLTPEAVTALEQGARRIVSFGGDESRVYDALELIESLRQGRMTPVEALVARTNVVDT